MPWAHGGEITADEMGELALLSLPVLVLLVVFVIAAQRARNRSEQEPARVPARSRDAGRRPGQGR